MIRGIRIKNIIENFKEDSNTLEYAKEYGINEVIDGHLYYTYSGSFSDEEIDEIIDILSNEFNL